MICFALHQTIVIPETVNILTNIGFTIKGGDPEPKMLLYCTVELALILLILAAFSVIINNAPLKYLFGKKRPVKAADGSSDKEKPTDTRDGSDTEDQPAL